MRNTILLIHFFLLSFSPLFAQQSSSPAPRKIQVALILDTGGSMDELLEYTKGTFWIMIDEILRQNDQYYAPELEFALYEYGSRHLERKKQFIRQVTPFTSDLDGVSSELFHLTVKSYKRGKSYCGAVLSAAVNELNWSPESRKMIIIAGNSYFRKGPTDYQRAIALAARKGITVNTIFAGDYRKGIQYLWQDAAFLGNGIYRNVELNIPLKQYYYPTFFDTEICFLNNQLNETYLPYGSQGFYYWNRCVEQDKFAGRYGEAYQSIRVLAKCRPGYRIPGWDLIDAIDAGQIRLEDIAEVDIPESLKNISREEQIAYLERMRKSREEIKSRILALQVEKEAEVRKQGRGIYGIIEPPFQVVVKEKMTQRIPTTPSVKISPQPQEIRQAETPVIRQTPPVLQQTREIANPAVEREAEARQQQQEQFRREQEAARERAAQIQREAEARQQQQEQFRREQEAARERAAQIQREAEVRQQQQEQFRREQEAARERAAQIHREVEVRQQMQQERPVQTQGNNTGIKKE
ncbi:MAG: vWA domain-containing protein [Bacteroidia bacterium]|nr:vWA domain-containing protein [Bacteroidia bacterium]